MTVRLARQRIFRVNLFAVLWRMKKIPVNIISGFLGSGKTTAIIKLLCQKPEGQQWAVIINEFGKVSIDSQTLRSSSDSGNIFEISGGCICCSAKGYFQENLEVIIKSGNYDRIIIEPSGLGGVEWVSEIVNANFYLKLMPVISLVDIMCVENTRLQINPIYRKQISKADIIVFSKCDLLTDCKTQDRLTEKFKSSFPEKQHYLSISEINLWISVSESEFLPAKNGMLFKMLFNDDSDLKDSNYLQNCYLFGVETIFNIGRLIQYFNSHPTIIRAKGHILTESGWNLFNYTLSGCNFEPCQIKENSAIVIIAEKTDPNLFSNLLKEIE